MEVLSLKPFLRVSSAHISRNRNSTLSRFNPCPTPHSKPSPSVSFVAPPRKPRSLKTLETQPDATPIARFCLLLPIFHSFGRFVLSRAANIRSWLKGGLVEDEGVCGNDLLCCGGIGMMLMSTTMALSKAQVSPFLWTLAGNPTFVSGLVAWALAQTIKMLLNFFVERRWDFGMLFSSGGMPSSHSALCMALTASVGMCHGAADSLFPVCLGFSLIVMYDATGVRRYAGMQAEECYYFKGLTWGKLDLSWSRSSPKLKKMDFVIGSGRSVPLARYHTGRELVIDMPSCLVLVRDMEYVGWAPVWVPKPVVKTLMKRVADKGGKNNNRKDE